MRKSKNYIYLNYLVKMGIDWTRIPPALQISLIIRINKHYSQSFPHGDTYSPYFMCLHRRNTRPNVKQALLSHMCIGHISQIKLPRGLIWWQICHLRADIKTWRILTIQAHLTLRPGSIFAWFQSIWAQPHPTKIHRITVKVTWAAVTIVLELRLLKC